MKFKSIILSALLVCSTLLAGSSCSSKIDIDSELQNAEMAIAMGDMDAATSVAENLSDGKNLSGLSAKQLARLSIVYMQIADSVDNGTNVNSAIEAYRRAYQADADSADAYYSALPSERAQYSMMLANIVAGLDTPYDADADMHADSIFDHNLLTDTLN